MPIQFHLDENVDGEIARGLRSRGIDVTTTADAGLGEATDEEHVAFALSQRRVIFTHDADFIRLACAGAEHRGIVYCPQRTRKAKEILARLALIHACVEPEEMRGRVEYI